MISVATYTSLQTPDFQSPDRYHYSLNLDYTCRDPWLAPLSSFYPSTMTSSQTSETSSTYELDSPDGTTPFEVFPELKIDPGFNFITDDPCPPLFQVKEEDRFSDMDLTDTHHSSTSSSPSPLQEEMEDSIQEVEVKNARISRRTRKIKNAENKKVDSRSARPDSQTTSNNGRRSKRGGKKQVRLWEFIKGLLENNDGTCHIKWVKKEEGTFRLLNSGAVAKMWGKTKNRTDMTYEKMSRAMRYYYAKEILLPIPQKLTYKFGDKIRNELNLNVQ